MIAITRRIDVAQRGLSGIVRDRKLRTTIAGVKDARRGPALFDRGFTAPAPNRKWVTDFTT